MLEIFYCIKNEHEASLIALAALVCIAAAWSSVLLLRQMQDSVGREKSQWRRATSVVSGCGIWATHFIAMLGYDPGVVAGYAIIPTIISLVVIGMAMELGFRIASTYKTHIVRVLSAVVISFGIAAMHYIGMSAVQIPGHFVWDYSFVVLSVIVSVVPIFAAIILSLERSRNLSGILAALCLVIGTIGIHFTGMTAISIVPGVGEGQFNLLISPRMMAYVIAGITTGIIALAVVAAFMRSRARILLLAREQEFSVLVKGIRDHAIYMLTPDALVSTWNIGAERLMGYSAEEVIGLHVRHFYSDPEQLRRLVGQGEAGERSLDSLHGEYWMRRKDGSCFWAHATIEAVYNQNGELRAYSLIIWDMSRLKRDQDKLNALTHNLDVALSNMKQGLCLFDADERLILFNQRATEMFGVTLKQSDVGMSFEDVFRKGLNVRAGEEVSSATLDEVIGRHRACLANPNGGTLIVPFTDKSIFAISHRPIENNGWVTTFDDITERHIAEQRIEHMALHDGLTGLPNRVHYLAELETKILKDRPLNGSKVAVLGIDLDRFKEVNDMHGHSTGDLVLKTIADRIAMGIQEGECIARFGGDEFAAYKCYRDEDDLNEFVSRLSDCFSEPLILDGCRIYPGASIGVAIYPDDGQTREQIVNNADLAMYRAKEISGQTVCYYEHGMDELARIRRRIANDLRMAIARNELTLAYQVQRSVSNGEITGYEALLRWNHSQDGWISPADFIPIAEESGEILRIGEWVLRQACLAAAQWEQPWRIAVNISAVQLMHVDLADTVKSALLESGLEASRLELEITETAIVSDKNRALQVLRDIKSQGVTIAIDDFGTGYSSLDTLNSFPFDKIKIDKSFLLSSDSSHQSRAIIRAVLALGRSLDVPVLAEGLETKEQLILLQSEGCDQAQGYLWGHPEIQ